MKSGKTNRRIALIGVGGHAAQHLATIRHLEKSGRVRLVAVADPFLERLPEVFESLVAAGVRCHRTHEDLLGAESGLDEVVISTPISLHEEMTRDVLARTGAGILLEKPAVPTIQQLDKLIALDSSSRVRVGFQMIHWPTVQFMKRLLCEGGAGTLRRIVVSAGWPRGSRYYRRASWAGKMVCNGAPVFDGPATNALAHILHNAMFFADSSPRSFASPEVVRGEFYRCRKIESYDFAWMQADLGGVEFSAALAHCVREKVPYRMRLDTDRGSLFFSEEAPHISNTLGLETELNYTRSVVKNELYDAFLGEGNRPTTLVDARGYTVLNCGALVSSGHIRDIPSSEVVCDGENEDVIGLHAYLSAFLEKPLPPSAAGFSWGTASQPVDCRALRSVDLLSPGQPQAAVPLEPCRP